jgi:plasmid stabilization system protein ParE
MSFRVELTAGAYADLDRLMTWLEERSSSDAADRFTARFSMALDRLESRPFSCGLAYENRHFPQELRHLLFEVWKGKPYRALFVVRDDVVTILCIRAPGEKPVKPKDVGLGIER